MTEKTKKTILWVLTGLVGALFAFSAFGKLSGNPDAVKMAATFGLSPTAFTALGVLEAVSLLLFIIPRTGILGALLLTAYMGGAIATHLEHGESIVLTCVIQAFIWIGTVLRFPELTQRILSKA
jgi:hypothetical protein